MVSVLKEIEKLRQGKPYTLDRSNSNRYRVVAVEDDGTKTAYCFSSPVYNKAGKLIDLRFDRYHTHIGFVGSDSSVHLGETAVFENEAGQCSLSLPGAITSATESSVFCGESEIAPTVNGLVFKVRCDPDAVYKTTLTAGSDFVSIRANNKSFSLMTGQFKPFTTVSCIGTLDGSGALIAPCELQYQTTDSKEYSLSIRPVGGVGKYILFEVNLHEPKMFLDTTVESRHPRDNNAFGGTAFIGNTAAYGEQWLYSRPELSLIFEFFDATIDRIVMHIPRLSNSKTALAVYSISNRFCGFGSNWENKITAAEELCDTAVAGGYHSIDVTALLSEKNTGRFKLTEGLILKPKKNDNGFAAVSTGDSCYAPQILEVNFS